MTARAIKEVASSYRVGGPATAGRAWLREMVDFASRTKAPLDFISTHDYGVKGIGFAEGSEQLKLIVDPGVIISGVRDSRSQISGSQLPKLPLHYTEWNSSYSSRDPVHDSYLSAAYILSRLKGSEGFADSMSYWTFTDIFEESGPAPSPFHGGFGLLNFNGLRKPSFYAYQFLNRLGKTELEAEDANSWVCKSDSGVQVLFWNYTAPDTSESNQKFFKRDIPAKDLGQAQISLAQLPPGNYRLNVHRVGHNVNDVYADYLKAGSPLNLTREQVRVLAEKNDGRAVVSTPIRISAGKPLRYELSLHENDVVLITLERM